MLNWIMANWFWIVMFIALSVAFISLDKYIVRTGKIRLENFIVNTLIVFLSLSLYGDFREGDMVGACLSIFLIISLVTCRIFKLTECKIYEYRLRKKYNNKDIRVNYRLRKGIYIVNIPDVVYQEVKSRILNYDLNTTAADQD